MFVKGAETEFNKHEDVIFDNGRVRAFISPKWWPNNPGNVLVIPHEHIENIYDIRDDILGEINQVAKRVATVMKENYGCDGISLRQQNEPAGNQDVWHFHLHIFPRWEGDELYLNHHKWRYVGAEERQPYAEKFKGKIII